MAKHFSNGQGRPRIPISNKHVESVHLDMWINWVSYDFSFSFWRSCYLRGTRDSPRKNEMSNGHLSKHDRNVSNDNWLRWVSIESYILHFILRCTNPVYYIYMTKMRSNHRTVPTTPSMTDVVLRIAKKKNAQFPQRICVIQRTLIRIRKWLLPPVM